MAVMIVPSKNMYYWHMPKTGGRWFQAALRQHLGGRFYDSIRPNNTIQALPEDRRTHWKVVASMREPCAWYASIYRMAMTGDSGRRKVEAWGGGSTEFRDFIRGVTDPSNVDVPEQFGPCWSFGHEWLPEKPNTGLYTWGMNWFLGIGTMNTVDILIDVHQAAHGFALIFGVQPELPPRNTFAQRNPGAVDPRTMYDDEMIKWVYEADGTTAHSLGYQNGPFEQAIHSHLILDR